MMDEHQYKAILAGLQQLTDSATTEEFGEYIDMRQDIRAWYEAGAQNKVPHRERLTALGLINAPVPTSEAIVNVRTESNHTASVIPLESQPTASVMVESSAPPTPSVIVPRTLIPSDPDDVYQERFDEGVVAMEDKHFQTAARIFAELQEVVRGRLKADVDRYYIDAYDQLGKEIHLAIELAQKADQVAKNDLNQRRNRWNSVLSLDSENDEARAGLERIDREEESRDFNKKLHTLKGRVDYLKGKKVEKFENDDLQKAEEFIAEFERLESLNPSSADILKLKQEIYGIRDAIRHHLGQISTLMAAGEYKDAYLLARQFLEAGIAEAIDQAAGTKIPTIQFFAQAREKLLAALRSRAAERQQRAEEQKVAGFPIISQQLLNEARDLLQDEALSEDDRGSLQPQVNDIVRALAELNSELASYEKAKALIVQSSKVAAHQKYDLLIQARVEYPRHPTIDQDIAHAEEGVAAVEANRLRQKLEEAGLKLLRDKFDEARTLVQGTLDSVVNQFALYLNTHPATEATQEAPNLAQRVREAEILLTDIAEKEAAYGRLTQKVDAMKVAITAFDAGESHKLAEIKDILESLTEEEEQHHTVLDIRRLLAKRQDHQQNWKDGERHYRSQHWQEAKASFDNLAQTTSTHRVKAEQWGKRAEAMLLLKAAVEAYGREDWAGARSLYSQVHALLNEAGVNGGDPNTFTLERAASSARDTLTELANLDAATEKVKRELSRAEKTFETARRATKASGWTSTMTPISEFKAAYDIVEVAKTERSTLRHELDETGTRIREEWHKAYLNAIESNAASDDLEVLDRAAVLANEAYTNNLLWDSKERALVNQLRARRLDVQYQDFVRRHQWSDAETNRKARLDIMVGKQEEIEREYRDALRHRVRKEVEEKLRNEPSTALPYLKEQLRHPDLVTDVALLGYAVELCWGNSDWTEAGRYAGRIGALPGQMVQGRVWERLTRIAASFKDSPQSAMSDLEALAKDSEVNRDAALLSLVTTKQDEFITKRLDELVEEGRTQARQRNEDSLIKAALAYSTALTLNSYDQRAADGLREIGSQLQPGLEAQCEQARHLNVASAASLDKTLSQAQELIDQLQAIYQVAEALRLDRNLKADLEETLEKLGKKRNVWSQVKTSLAQARRQVEQSLQSPSRESGWDFKNAYDLLNNMLAQRTIPNEERACREMLTAEMNRIRGLEEQGIQLFDVIHSFMQHVTQEAFDKALAQIPTLTTTLTTASNTSNERWGGLDYLFQHDYRYFGARREVRTWEDHRVRLTESQRNLEEWQRWASAVREQLAEADKYAKMLRKGFENLREDENKALDAILKLCNDSQNACNELEDRMQPKSERNPDGKPTGSVLSERAREEEQSAIVETLENIIKGHRDLAKRIQKEAETHRTLLKEKMKPLRQIMGQLESQRQKVEQEKAKKIRLPGRKPPEVARGTINSAISFLEECRTIDPHDADVIRYEKQLTDWGYLK